MEFEDLYAVPSRNGLNRPRRVRGAGFKMVNMGELFAHDRIWDQEMDRVPMDEAEQTDYGLAAGDLLFARQSLVAAGTGKCSIVLGVSEPTTFESHIIRVRLNEKKVVPLFYYYYFASRIGKANIQSLVMQVAAAGIRGSELAKLKIPCPPMPTQHRIAAILGAYDELIENNERRIALLDETARRLYKEWFVDLRFPGHEKVKISGSKPEGWTTQRLGEVADVNATLIRRGEEPDTIKYVSIASVSKGTMHEMESMPFKDAPGRARRRVKDGDVIWSAVRPNLRGFALVLDPAPNLVVSTGFAVISPRTVPYSYLYQVVTTEDFIGYLINHTRGAAYPAVNAEDFENAKVLVPSETVLNQYHLLASDLLRMRGVLLESNAKLREARDLALPRLISGELDVSDLDIPTEALA